MLTSGDVLDELNFGRLNMDANDIFWLELFPADTAGERVSQVDMRVLRRNGKPFLLLPCQRRVARGVLSLYAAQTARARAAKLLWNFCLTAGLPLPASQRVRVPIAGQDPFVRFLSAQSEPTSDGLPGFGVLAGNPAAPGRRLILLVSDARGKPAAVVKIGFNPHARELIDKEERFLSNLAGRPEMPAIRGKFESPRLRALSLQYYPGDSPGRDDPATVARILGSWVDRNRRVAIGSMPDWQRLEAAAGDAPGFRRVREALAGKSVHPVIHHGDFAPWNLKVSSSGEWTVLDWERGELTGIPGWDWLHFMLQPKILVEHRGTGALMADLEALLSSEPFHSYAQKAGSAGLARDLALAYMLYTVHVIRPAEGLQQMKALAERYCTL